MPVTAIATAGRILLRMLERRSIEPAPLFKEAGLETESMHDPLVRYTGKEARLFWTRVSGMLDDPTLGLTIGYLIASGRDAEPLRGRSGQGK